MQASYLWFYHFTQSCMMLQSCCMGYFECDLGKWNVLNKLMVVYFKIILHVLKSIDYCPELGFWIEVIAYLYCTSIIVVSFWNCWQSPKIPLWQSYPVRVTSSTCRRFYVIVLRYQVLHGGACMASSLWDMRATSSTGRRFYAIALRRQVLHRVLVWHRVYGT